jgi:hypothetical protein
MKTIFDNTIREDLIQRIEALSNNHTAQWGKMSVYQMVNHMNIWNDWVLGTNKPTYKQEFLGLIFGKMALKSNVKDDRPIQKKMPAGNAFLIKEKNGDIGELKKRWIKQVAAFEYYSNPDFIHDFFGKMTPEQIGIFAYKHTDHHLRQFNV